MLHLHLHLRLHLRLSLRLRLRLRLRLFLRTSRPICNVSGVLSCVWAPNTLKTEPLNGIHSESHLLGQFKLFAVTLTLVVLYHYHQHHHHHHHSHQQKGRYRKRRVPTVTLIKFVQ